jgi:hypothetical protein
MRPGCGAPLLIGLVVVIVLPGQTRAQAKKPELQHLPPAPTRPFLRFPQFHVMCRRQAWRRGRALR